MPTYSRPWRLLLLIIVITNLLLACSNKAPPPDLLPDPTTLPSTPLPVSNTEPATVLNRDFFEKLRPLTDPLEELEFTLQVKQALLSGFQAPNGFSLKAYVTFKPYDFSLINQTLTDLNYYLISSPLDRCYFWGSFYLNREAPDTPQLALKYVSLNPGDTLASQQTILNEFSRVGLDPINYPDLYKQLEGVLHLFILIVGQDLLENYSTSVESAITSGTPFQFSQTGSPITITESGADKGDLQILTLVQEASSSWKTASLESKGLTLFSSEIAERFNTDRLEAFSLKVKMSKPWRMDTNYVSFYAEMEIGESRNHQLVFTNQRVYLRVDGRNWTALSSSDEVGYQLYLIVMSLVFPLPETYQLQGWFFTPLEDDLLEGKVVGRYRLESGEVDDVGYIRIEVSYDKLSNRLCSYLESQTTRGILEISYKYDDPTIKIEVPDTSYLMRCEGR
jgi:hypothetical protein